MTPEERNPRKRRRRRRRPQTPGTAQQAVGNDGGAPQSAASEAKDPQNPAGQRPGRARRRRSRHRGRRPEGGQPETQGDAEPMYTPGETVAVDGILYVKPNGVGILVGPSNNYVAQPGDPIVPRAILERNNLQAGIRLEGQGRRTGNGVEMTQLENVEGLPLAEYQESRRPFSELISVDPLEQFKLETDPGRLTTRVLDLLAPIGKGQRCLIVAPPKAGKTTLLKDIAHGIEMNHPEAILIVLLVDERPEEVTDFRRSVEHGEVVASSSDENAESHIHLAEIILERARRLVETKKDVVILCDSITRMSRAYNNEQRGSGKILSGGIDARTMEKPRRFFGAARNAEDWGSLTIIATALVDTDRRAHG